MKTAEAMAVVEVAMVEVVMAVVATVVAAKVAMGVVEPKTGMVTTNATTIDNQRITDQPQKSSWITQEDRLGLEVEEGLFLHPRKEDSLTMVGAPVEEVAFILENLLSII